MKNSTIFALLITTNSFATIPIENLNLEDNSIVAQYWSRHTVHNDPFKSREDSLEYLKWRNKDYPLFQELMNLWGDRRQQLEAIARNQNARRRSSLPSLQPDST